MKFYTFRQNNSGGRFHVDDAKGIERFVIIEARDHLEANVFAEDLGLHWDGVASGNDCGCCGDRWDRVNECDGHETPSIYENEPVEFGPFPASRKTLDYCGFVHFRDGAIKTFYNGQAWNNLKARMMAEAVAQ